MFHCKRFVSLFPPLYLCTMPPTNHPETPNTTNDALLAIADARETDPNTAPEQLPIVSIPLVSLVARRIQFVPPPQSDPAIVAPKHLSSLPRQHLLFPSHLGTQTTIAIGLVSLEQRPPETQDGDCPVVVTFFHILLWNLGKQRTSHALPYGFGAN